MCIVPSTVFRRPAFLTIFFTGTFLKTGLESSFPEFSLAHDSNFQSAPMTSKPHAQALTSLLSAF